MSTLANLLPTLETRGLLRVTMERDQPIVRFKHALTREATYNTILQARRAELHRAAAQTLSAMNPQPDLEMVLTIADHWRRGNEDGQALESVLPHAQPLIYTGRSLSLTALLTRLQRENLNETQQRDLDIALADAHAARGEYVNAKEIYERVLQQQTKDPRRPRLLHSLGAAAYHLNENERAIEYQRESLHLAKEAGNLHLQARASSGLGLAYWSLGDYPHAEEHLKTSLELGRQIGESIELANAESNIVGISLDRGDYQTALEFAEQAVRIYEKLGHEPLMVRAIQMLGAAYYGKNDLPKAALEYRRAIAKSRESGDNFTLALGLGNLAEVYLDWNQLDQAALCYGDAIEKLRVLKYGSLLVYDLAGLGDVQVRLAAATQEPSAGAALLNQAETHASEALSLALQIHLHEGEGIARRVLAEILAARGDIAQAHSQIQQAITLLQELGRVLELERAQATARRILGTSGSAPIVIQPKEVSI